MVGSRLSKSLIQFSIDGLTATSSKRSYTTSQASQVCCSQSPCAHGKPPLLRVPTWRRGDTWTLKGRSGSVSVESLGPGAHKVLFEPSISDGCGVLIINVISPLILSCWGFSFALGLGYLILVGSNILLSMVVQHWVAVLEFSQEKMRICPSTLPSWNKVKTAKYDTSQPSFFTYRNYYGTNYVHWSWPPWWQGSRLWKDVDQNRAQWLSHNSNKKVKLQLNSYEVWDFFLFHIDCFAHLFLHIP